jgi:hypothetical protein
MEIRNKLQITLIHTFSNSDEVTKDATRLFFGGRRLICENYNSMINAEDIITRFYKEDSNMTEVERKGDYNINKFNSINILVTQNPEHSEQYNLKALRDRDFKFLNERLNNSPIEFDNESEFWKYVFRINMSELLGFQYSRSIKCVFHQDNKPSASVFCNEDGIWFYKCHSGKCGHAMNIKDFVEKIGNFQSEFRAVEFIKNIYNLSIKESKWSIEQKSNLDSILYKIDMNTFSELCPQADKNTKHIQNLFSILIHIAKDNIYGENYMNSNGDAVFFVSLGELARLTKTAQNNPNRISQRLSVLIR